MRLISKLFAVAVAVVLCASPAVAARRLSAGAVASPDQYGALAAKDVLQHGGNAVDAAVATGFALAVTYPEAGNLGGGGFMTLWVRRQALLPRLPRNGAGRRPPRGMYLDAKGESGPHSQPGRQPVVRRAGHGPRHGRGAPAVRQAQPGRRDLAPAIRYRAAGVPGHRRS